MSKFINIHVLISHPSSMMNRDDAGMQKTAVFGGTTRTRITSQCLKRAIRESDIYKANVNEVSIRTNRFDDLLKLCVDELPEFSEEEIEAVLENLSGKKIKVEKDKETGEKTRMFDAVQPYSVGAIRELVLMVQEGLELKGIKNKIQLPTIDVALTGRMDASNPIRDIEGAMSVAHSITTHGTNIEVDWFTACDDLSKQGSGHIGTTEFSSGVFYRFASIDLELLSQNTKMSSEQIETVLKTIVKCFAQVTPSGKQKSFAAYNKAEFVLVTKDHEALSLANAFRKPIENDGNVMEASVEAMIRHYEKQVAGYGLESNANGFDLTDTCQSPLIKNVPTIDDLI